jgi:hypothetical protein
MGPSERKSGRLFVVRAIKQGQIRSEVDAVSCLLESATFQLAREPATKGNRR